MSEPRDDIVSTLRTSSAMSRKLGLQTVAGHTDAAADEIERLRAALAAAGGCDSPAPTTDAEQWHLTADALDDLADEVDEGEADHDTAVVMRNIAESLRRLAAAVTDADVFGAPLVSEQQIRGVCFMLDNLIRRYHQAQQGMGGDSELLRSSIETAEGWLAAAKAVLYPPAGSVPSDSPAGDLEGDKR